MPRPRKGEKKKEFVARYMASEEAKQTYPDPKQRYAVANGVWDSRKNKAKKKAKKRQEQQRKRRKRK